MKPKARKRQRPMAEINVVPYIDVMLVLLVIFMITAPLLSQGVQVNLPQAQAKPLDEKNNQPIIVSVDAGGRYYLNIASDPAKPVSAEEMMSDVSAKISAATEQGNNQAVLIKGDKDVNYDKVVQAMVLLQQAGVANIGLMTDSPNNDNNNQNG